ncbi:hypothetical protein BJX66DRAFT_293076 [Aspergillus keveii]|uniref:Uncharacterized protein n=1 Tax=Aspergillus keveii TaxID=714993 RepID=A0ABR4GKH5_9EURO
MWSHSYNHWHEPEQGYFYMSSRLRFMQAVGIYFRVWGIIAAQHGTWLSCKTCMYTACWDRLIINGSQSMIEEPVIVLQLVAGIYTSAAPTGSAA